jgi:hypothetical protein
MTMQGAPLTVHVTSPTRALSSVIVKVLAIVPLMFAASAFSFQTLDAPTTARQKRKIRALST